MSFQSFYIPSTNEGKTWCVGYSKPGGRPGVVSATEGESEVTPDGVRIFKAVLIDANRVRHPLAGRATKRAVAQALCELLCYMEQTERISHEDAMKWVQRAQAYA
jgi:hypothetical protein